MTIECLEIAGLRSALEALRLPYDLEPRSVLNYSGELYKRDDELYDSTILTQTHIKLHKKDLSLLQALVKRGPEHAKCIRGISVYAKITAPIYWWCEMETYGIGHDRLASASTMHVDCKGLSGEELVEAKANIPMGKELTKIDRFNYQSLRNIFFQRRNHRLPEWHVFCNWIESLPYAKELITIENVNNKKS